MCHLCDHQEEPTQHQVPATGSTPFSSAAQISRADKHTIFKLKCFGLNDAKKKMKMLWMLVFTHGRLILNVSLVRAIT